MKDNYDLVKRVIGQTLRQRPSRVKIQGKSTPLKKLRVSKGLTGRAAAECLGVSYRNYYRLENRPIESIPTTILLAVKLGAFDNPENRDSVLGWWKHYDNSN